MHTTFDPAGLQILLVDDEPEILELTGMTLQGEGFCNIVTTTDSTRVPALLERNQVSVVVLDLMMPNVSGTELLQAILCDHPKVPVIVMTAMDDVETAVECLKIGAFDYLVKPVDPDRLVTAVRKAVRLNTLEQEVSSLKECLLSDRLINPRAFSKILTCNKKMRAVFQYTEVISRTRQPILITGETGAGKELIAEAIHAVSGVPGEFVTINVAGLDDLLFSDTLFGHTRGAYTGAEGFREGLIQKADNGTLFLDEIGDLSQSSQVKLLRLLQSSEYYPLGSDTLKSGNARIVVATNQDLSQLMAEGKFRKDLYYRLCTYQVHVPPLRERPDDIPLLLNHFVRLAARALQREIPEIHPMLPSTLVGYPFPGNVRELQAIIYDAIARNSDEILTAENFSGIYPARKGGSRSSATTLDTSDALCRLFGKFPTMDEVEECMITAAMKLAKQRRGIAASMLGITRQSLHRRLKIVPARDRK